MTFRQFIIYSFYKDMIGILITFVILLIVVIIFVINNLIIQPIKERKNKPKK